MALAKLFHKSTGASMVIQATACGKEVKNKRARTYCSGLSCGSTATQLWKCLVAWAQVPSESHVHAGKMQVWSNESAT